MSEKALFRIVVVVFVYQKNGQKVRKKDFRDSNPKKRKKQKKERQNAWNAYSGALYPNFHAPKNQKKTPMRFSTHVVFRHFASENRSTPRFRGRDYVGKMGDFNNTLCFL